MLTIPQECTLTILLYCARDYRTLRAISTEIYSIVTTTYYFRACGPVAAEWIPPSAHPLVGKFTQPVMNLLWDRKLSLDYIYARADEFGSSEWKAVSSYSGLSESFLHAYEHKVDWWELCDHYQFSESFILAHLSRLSEYDIFYTQIVSEEFIRAHASGSDWIDAAIRQDISDEFVRDHPHELGWLHNPADPKWDAIAAEHTLPEEFISRHRVNLNWDILSRDQVMSDTFMLLYSDYVNWDIIFAYHEDTAGLLEKKKIHGL